MGLPPGGAARRRSSGSLPHWLLAQNEAAGESAAADAGDEQTVSEAIDNSAAAAEGDAKEAVREPLQNETPLSEEQLGALSAQLVEAKHEETQARVSGDAVIEEAELFDEEEDEEEIEFNATSTEQEEEEEIREEEPEHSEEAAHEDTERAETKQEAELRRDEEHEAAEAYREQEEKHEALRGSETEGRQEGGPVGEHEQGEGQYFEEKAQGFAAEAIIEEDVILLPGETRAPRNPSAPREEFPRRDSARIGSNPRSRFQRPQRGGRDRDRGRGDRGGRPDRGRGGDRGGRGRFEPRRSGSGGGAPSPGGHQRHSSGHHSHGHGHAPQRRPQLISEMLKAGED